MKSDRGDIELAGVCKSFDGVTNVVDGVNLRMVVLPQPDGPMKQQ